MTIYFYGTNDAYGCFSNFSAHDFELRGKRWPTSEHYFQAQKFAGISHEGEVRRARSPRLAASMGRERTRPLRTDWEAVKENVMYEALVAKFTQNDDAREELLATDNRPLVENSPVDWYWGIGSDGKGKNRLGVLLVRLREELRATTQSHHEDEATREP